MVDLHPSSLKGMSHSSSPGGGDDDEEEEEDAASSSDRAVASRSGSAVHGSAMPPHSKMPASLSSHSSRPNSRDQSPLHAAGGRYFEEPAMLVDLHNNMMNGLPSKVLRHGF